LFSFDPLLMMKTNKVRHNVIILIHGGLLV
jgi:hypothetical protein